jgi:predicted Mrr-cat superfamily restriction endonuclease
MKHLWLVRLGRHAEEEARALAQSELMLGFKVGELSNAKSAENDMLFGVMPP